MQAGRDPLEQLQTELEESEQRYQALKSAFEQQQQQIADQQVTQAQLQHELRVTQRTLAAYQRRSQEQDLVLSLTSPTLLQAILESTADGILVVSQQGQVLSYNQKFIGMWAIPVALLTPGSSPSERFQFLADQTQDPEGFQANVLKLFDQTPETTVFDLLAMRDGRIFERYSQPIWFDQQIIGRVWSYRDVTEHKQPERVLCHSEAWFRAMFEQAAVGIALVDPQLRYLSVNQRFCNLVGYTEAELADLTFVDITHPDDLDSGLDLTQRLFAGDIDDFSVEKRYVCKDGQVKWVHLSVSLVRDALGQPAYDIAVIEDISDRKRAEAAVRSQERQLRLITDALPVCIAYIDANRRYRFVNQTYETWFGYRREDLYGKHLAEVIGEAAYQITCDKIDRVLTGETVIYEAELPYQEGGTRFVNGNLIPDVDAQGQVKGYFALIADITERKRAEAAMRSQAQRQQALNRVIQTIRSSLDLAQVFEAAIAEIGQFLTADQVSVLQYHPDPAHWQQVASYCSEPSTLDCLILDVVDIPITLIEQFQQHDAICVPEDIAQPKDFMQSLAASFPGSWLLVPLRVGMSVWGMLCLRRVEMTCDWQNSEIELAGAVTDQLAIAIQQAELYQQVQQLNIGLETQVQERTAQLQRALGFDRLLRRITDKVRDSLDQNQILQAAVQELVLELEADGCDTSIYNADQTQSILVCEYSYRLPSHQGQVVNMMAHADEYHLLLQGQTLQFCSIAPSLARSPAKQHAILACPIADDQEVMGDLRLFRPPHQTFDEMEVRLVEQVASQCAIALRQARLYEAAQAQVRELEKLNCLKDDFLSTVSHELRTPMSSIQMATQMLEVALRQTNLLSDPQQRIGCYLDILQTECHREIRLINDLLDLSRLDAGTEPLTPITINPGMWIAHVAEPFITQLATQQQQLQLDLPDTLPLLTTDLSLLERILSELLQNAHKYTPAGETITLAAQATPDQLHIQISNSGVEIPAAEHDRIFDKFYRIPNSDPWKHGGTGLGLALVRKLADHLGATVSVTSQNRCTTFTVILPLTIDESATAS